MSYHVKFNYNGTFRRTAVDSLTQEAVEKAARAVFVIPPTQKVTLTWVDEEGDTVHVSSAEEFREFLAAQTFPGLGRVMGHSSPALYKFGVVTEEPPKPAPKKAQGATDSASESEGKTADGKSVHRHVACDGCGVCPLVGIRYKCTGRVDYDLCEDCEQKSEQPFPMLKMYEPKVGIRIAVKGQGFGPQINKRRGRDASIPPPPPFEGPVVHEGVTCDQCGVGPVLGIRFKCTGREDFDLCSACEAFKPQPFPMIKIYRPDISVHVRGWGTEGRRCPANPHGFTNFPFFHGKGGRGGGGGCGGKWRHCHSKQGDSGCEAADMWPRKGEAVEAIASVVSNVAEAAKSFMEDVDEQILKQTMEMSMDEGSKDKNKEQSKSTGSSPASSAATFSGVNLRTLKPMARFVGDITIPDATVVAPSTDFVKIWLVRNDGPCDWPTFGDGVRLVTAGGDPLCDAALSIPVESIRVGEETHISVTLKSPPTPGRYVSYFRLQAADGIVFGQKLWVDIRVQATSGHVGFTSPAFAVGKPATQNEDGAESKATEAPLAVTLATTLPSSETGSESPVEMEFPGGDFEEVSPATVPVEAATATEPAGAIDEDALWEAEREQMEQDWKVELDALKGMGFHDTRENVKLLKKHTKTSFGRFPQLQGKPFSDSLSTILDALLH